jgi:hypothetical protein
MENQFHNKYGCNRANYQSKNRMLLEDNALASDIITMISVKDNLTRDHYKA